MRQIALVGAAITQEELLEIGAEWELWSLNNLFGQFPDVHFDRWYELHVFQRHNNRYIRRGVDTYGARSVWQYMHAIADLRIPVYMQKEWAIIPQSIKFPFKEIIKEYGSYFGCSFAWMMAHILWENAHNKDIDSLIEKIGFFGIALEGIEYFYQRPSTEYFIGLARGMGIDIYIHNSSKLLRGGYLYAYKENFDEIGLNHGEIMRILMHTVGAAYQQIVRDVYERLTI